MQEEIEGYHIYHDLIIDSSAERVFRSVTQPEDLVKWWPQKCTGQPIEGAEYNFYFAPEYDWFGEVIKCEPNKSFHIKMTKSDTDWDPTSFGFDLVEVDDKTQLHFWHVGWPQCNSHYKQSSYCWALLLHGLKNYIEKGVIVPFDERA